jgi:hypothetical protein
MQQAVLCYFNSTQIFLLLCLHNRGVHCEIDVYSFKGLSYSGPDTVGVRLSCIYAFSVWRPLKIQRLFSSRFYTSVILFLHMLGTPVSYRHFCIYQAHQCRTDISAYIRNTNALQTFLHMSGTPVSYRLFLQMSEHQCLTDISAYVRHTSALQTFIHVRHTSALQTFLHVRHTSALQTFIHVRHTSALQTFLRMSGTPVPYRYFCICQSHQCLTDITFVSVLQLTLHNVAKV